MTNELKRKALESILNATNDCVIAYNQYENNTDEEMNSIYENIWSRKEDILMGMRRLYKATFDENAPRARSELKYRIHNLT